MTAPAVSPVRICRWKIAHTPTVPWRRRVRAVTGGAPPTLSGSAAGASLRPAFTGPAGAGGVTQAVTVRL